jgi:hypothetical protein
MVRQLRKGSGLMTQQKSARVLRRFDYDVSLSFAGENRTYVRQVAHALRLLGVRVFFDEYEEATLWGKDLYTHLSDIYQNSARFCVLFVSKQYAKKVWTNHERQSAQARAIREHAEYILPARFDNTVVPGLRSTVHYIDLRQTSPQKVARLLFSKLGDRQVENYFPPVPDRLFTLLDIKTARKEDAAATSAHKFFISLGRMNEEERHVLMNVFRYGCPNELPGNIHISIDLLRRVSGIPPSRAVRVLDGIRSLGVESKIRRAPRRRDSEGDVVVVQWHDTSIGIERSNINATKIACAVIDGALEGYCSICGTEHLKRMDFSQLATATSGKEKHKQPD